jgi:fibronectin type 3 domain-containing protein
MKRKHVAMNVISVALIWIGTVLAAGCGQEDTLESNPPDAPTEVRATVQWENISVQVIWAGAAGADRYMVYRSDAADGEYTAISGEDGVAGMSFTDTSLPFSAATYYYKVAARNAAGTGTQSSSVSVTLAAPATPTGVSAWDLSSTSIGVSWSPVSGATRYYVYRSTSGDGEYSLIDPTASASVSYTDTGLSPNATYYYKVEAWNDIGTSPQSSSVSATTPPPPLPAAPSGVRAFAQTSYIGTDVIRSIEITWNAVSGATGYIVYRSTSPNGEYSSIGSTTQRSWTTSGTRYVTYYFKVAAYNSTGTGPLSSYDSAAIR